MAELKSFGFLGGWAIPVVVCAGAVSGCWEADIGRGINESVDPVASDASTTEKPPGSGTAGGGAEPEPTASQSGGTTSSGGAAGGGSSSVGGAGGAMGGGASGGEGGAGGASAGGTDSGGAGGEAAGGGAGGEAAGGEAAGGEGGTGGEDDPGPVLPRYARLVALTEQSGDVFSSVAELNLLGAEGTPISRSGWTVTADSEEVVDESAPASAAIDGDDTTFWHSEWSEDGSSDAPLPHELVVDLGAAREITGFSYLPRQDFENGRIAQYEFYLSTDGQDWGDPVAMGTFPASTALQTVTF